MSVVFLYMRDVFLFSLNSNFSCITCSSRCQLLLVPKLLLICHIFQKQRVLRWTGAPKPTSNVVCLRMSLKTFRSARLRWVVESRRVLKVFWGRRSERWSWRKKNWNKYKRHRKKGEIYEGEKDEFEEKRIEIKYREETPYKERIKLRRWNADKKNVRQKEIYAVKLYRPCLAS